MEAGFNQRAVMGGQAGHVRVHGVCECVCVHEEEMTIRATQ